MTVTARRAAPGALPAMAWTTLAVVGWTMIGWIAAQLFATDPPSGAFDLELVLLAGRDVASGRSAYDPALVAGTAPDATALFFSYPPIVAQVLVPFAGVPSAAMFVGWSVLAVVSLAAATDRIRLVLRPAVSGPAASLAVVAVASLTFPFVVAILFGNLDAFFPAAYGLALVAAVGRSRGERIAGGVAIAVASLAKLYPAGLGLWFAVRAVRARSARGPDAGADGQGLLLTLGAAAATAALLVLGSLVVGGLEPWREYATVVGVASRAELVDPKNVAPAAQIALLAGADSALARTLHLAVVGAALLVIAWAAVTRRDTVESLAIAAAATLVLLPVAWIHYPAALIPFGAAAAMRSLGGPAARRVATLLVAAVALGVVALAWLPLMWLGVLACLAAVHASAPLDPGAGEVRS